MAKAAVALGQRQAQGCHAPRPYLTSFGEGDDAAHDDLRGMPMSTWDDGSAEYVPPPDSAFLKFLDENPSIRARLAVSDANVFVGNGAICARLARGEQAAPAAATRAAGPTAVEAHGATADLVDAPAAGTLAGDASADTNSVSTPPDPAAATPTVAPAAAAADEDAVSADPPVQVLPAAPPAATDAAHASGTEPSGSSQLAAAALPLAANYSAADASAADALPVTSAAIVPVPAAADTDDPAGDTGNLPLAKGHTEMGGSPYPPASAPAAAAHSADDAPAAAISAVVLEGKQATPPSWFGNLLRVSVRLEPGAAFTGALICCVQPAMLVCDSGEWLSFETASEVLELTSSGDIKKWDGAGGLVAGVVVRDAAVGATYIPKSKRVAGGLIGQCAPVFDCTFVFGAHFLAMPSFCEPAAGQRQLRGTASHSPNRNRQQFATFRRGDILVKNMELCEEDDPSAMSVGGAPDKKAVVARVIYIPASSGSCGKAKQQCRKLLLLCEHDVLPRRYFVSQWGHWQRRVQPGVAATIDIDCHDFAALKVEADVLASIEEVCSTRACCVSWLPPSSRAPSLTHTPPLLGPAAK